jgi:hypothetical protein
MRFPRIRRPSPALVIAVIALFISMGGVSYGLATGSIDSREIRNNTIMSRDIRNNTINGRDIRTGAVFGSDIHRSTITGGDVRDGALGGADIQESSLAQVPSAAKAGNVMAASAPTTGSCTLDSNTGGITATQSGNTCDVTFPRSVANCAVGATPLHPTSDVGGEATIRKLGGAVVRVGRYDSAGGTPTAGLFSVFAVCP